MGIERSNCFRLLSKRIGVILDNAKYHYSSPVKTFLADSKIKLAFLSSDSPNFNLIERLWKFFKKKVLYNQYYENINAFRKACIKCFRNIDPYHNDLEELMTADFEFA